MRVVCNDSPIPLRTNILDYRKQNRGHKIVSFFRELYIGYL